MMLHSERPKTGHGRRRGPACGGYYDSSASSTRNVESTSNANANAAVAAAAAAAAAAVNIATEAQQNQPATTVRPKTGHGRRQTVPEQAQTDLQQQQQHQLPAGIGSSDADVLILDDPRPQTAATARRRRPQTGYGRRRPPVTTMQQQQQQPQPGEPLAFQGRPGLRSGSARQHQQHHRNTIEDAMLLDLQQPLVSDFGAQELPIQAEFPALAATFPSARPFSSKYKVLPDISGNGNGLQQQQQQQQQQPQQSQLNAASTTSQANSSTSVITNDSSRQVIRPEPGPSSPRLLLALRMPNGSRMQRHFRPDSPLIDVRRFAELAAEEDFSECEFVRADDRTAFRRRQLERSIRELGISDRSLLILQEALDDDDDDEEMLE